MSVNRLVGKNAYMDVLMGDEEMDEWMSDG